MPIRKSKILLITPIEESGHLDVWHAKILQILKEMDCDSIELTPSNKYSNYAFKSIVQSESRGVFSQILGKEAKKIKNIIFDDKIIITLKKIAASRLSKFVPKFVKNHLLKIISGHLQKDVFTLMIEEWDLVPHVKMAFKLNRNINAIIISYFDAISAYTAQNILDIVDVPVVSILFKYDPEKHSKILSKFSQNSLFLTVDNSTTNAIRQNHAKLSIHQLPDFPTFSSSNKNSNLFNSFHNSNKTIGLIGSISGRKSLQEIINVAISTNGLKYNWLIAGVCYLDGTTAEFRKLFGTIMDGSCKNIKIINKYLSLDEFNYYFSEADVHLLLYKNWKGASNMATNCFIAKKPFLVYENSPAFDYFIGSGIALAVREDLSNFFESINELENLELDETRRNLYLRENSSNRFSEELQKALNGMLISLE